MFGVDMPETDNITIQQVDISALNPAEYNPRQANEKEYADLKASIQTFGLVDPIIANSASNRLNTVIGGHFRLKIAKAMGYTQVPVVYVNVPDIKQEKELNLRLNKNLGQWDYDLLANFDEELLKSVGFDSQELDKIFQIDTDKDPDNVPEVRQTDIKAGQVYVLGNHRLMCGDATKREDVERLMAGQKADMVFTDPPYGMGKKIQNDDRINDKLVKWNALWVNELPIKEEHAVIIFHSPRMFWTVLYASQDLVFQRYLTLYKPNDRSYPHFKWITISEAILVFSKGKLKLNNKAPIGHDVYIHKHTNESLKETGGTGVHPTVKPIWLCEDIIEKCANREDIVLDLFGGSGSTLIACERLNRKCFMMEIDCLYCQVIIDRWEKYTNQKAVKV